MSYHDIFSGSGVNVETKCVNGKKQVVNKGELEEVVCTGKNKNPKNFQFSKEIF